MPWRRLGWLYEQELGRPARAECGVRRSAEHNTLNAKRTLFVLIHLFWETRITGYRLKSVA